VIDQREHVEDRNKPDCVRGQNEYAERQEQRRPGVHPLATDIRFDDPVADEFDHGFERVHETRGDEAILSQVATHGDRDDEEHERRDHPEHEDMLGDGEVDAEERWEVNERVIQRAVRDVLDDHLAGVELLGGL